MEEAKTYYANIVMPYGKSVPACLERMAELEIEMIAPSHGDDLAAGTPRRLWRPIAIG